MPCSWNHSTQKEAIGKELLRSAPCLSATADGRWILYVQVDQTESDIMLVGNFS